MVSGAFRVGDGYGPVLREGNAEVEVVEDLDDEETAPEVGELEPEGGFEAGELAARGKGLDCGSGFELKGGMMKW